MRLKPSVERVLHQIQHLKAENDALVDASFESIVAPLSERYTKSTTGFGDTIVKIDALQSLPKTKQRKVLDLIYEAVHRLEVQRFGGFAPSENGQS
jgi:hypothetical protein